VGKFPNTVSGLMPWALRNVQIRCDEVGLPVNPDKPRLVVFTRRRKLPGFLEPHSRGSPGLSADVVGACGCQDKKGSQSVVGV
jgi:hypothetical protein